MRESRDPESPGERGRAGLPDGTMTSLTRVRFTREDLTRVRISSVPAPLVEATMGFAELRHQMHQGVRSSWAVQARRVFPVSARPLLDLIPPSGPWPPFLDPATADLDEGLDIVTATPRWLLRVELAASWRGATRPPIWLRALADGDRDAMTTVVQALRDFYAACVAPSWPEITALFRAEVAERAAILARGGLGELFGTLHADLAWRAGALERAGRSLGRAGLPGELRLDGQGLQIMPAVMWTGPPLFSVRPLAPAFSHMIYPVRPVPIARSTTVPRDLAALMGRTRAAVMHALCDPCGTGELAARVGISVPSASEHAAALRHADLVQTERLGRGVRHSLTALGRSLLDGSRDAGGRSGQVRHHL